MLYIQKGLIHTPQKAEPFVGDIIVNAGKIVQIGKHIPVKGDCETFNASGLNVFPGFIDAHSHLGTFGTGIGFEGEDANEMNDIITPQLRAIDCINPFDDSFAAARKSGVTTVGTGPGSANVLGGTFAAIKTAGIRIDDMIVKNPVALKCAFGENPKRCYKDKCAYSRMTTAALLRETLFMAKEYMLRCEAAGNDISKRPPFNLKYESLIPVLKKQIPLKAHVHQANDIFTALRIAQEFDLNITLEHVTEGHLIADYLAQQNVPLAIGPTLTFSCKYELRNKTWETPAILAKAGCKISIITDSPVIPQEYLPLCAGMAIKAGLNPWEALAAITLNPAIHLGIEDTVGSIEVGKDADLVITSGSPFEIASEIKAVFINGEMI